MKKIPKIAIITLALFSSLMFPGCFPQINIISPNSSGSPVSSSPPTFIPTVIPTVNTTVAPVLTPAPQTSLASSIPSTKSTCNWINDYDPNGGEDTGRGITDWQIHYNYLINYNAGDKVPDGIKTRLTILLNCLSKEKYAKLYADLSVLTAKAGTDTTSTCNWIDGYDSNAGEDTGRGITDWQTHYNYLINYNAGDKVPDGIKTRLTILLNCLSKEKYAKLYADLSVLIAKAGLGIS
jgi:hypothetical protein